MTDSERKARIKEINKELTQLSNAEGGLKRASMYGNVGDVVKRNKERQAELSAELRELERVGTFKMSDVLQWGIDDAKAEKAATSTQPLASNSRMSVEQGREYVKKLSENRGIDEELSKLYAYQAGYKEQEKFDEINKYTTEITSKKDFEQNSKYSPKKPKTEAELKKAGYKKNREGQWYIRSFAGAPEYYQGEDSGNYIYINDKSKREALASESRQQTRGGSFGINSYGKEGYDFLTDAEIGAYNYLYNTKGEKKADEYLEKIRPLLQQRAMEAEAERFAEDAKESPIMMSVFSLGTNLANAAMFPMKAAATLAGEYDDAPTLDRFGNITQAIRGAVSEDMPYLGSLLYNGAMSIGDMGTAMLVGGGNAKAIQAIMSSSAGSSTISEAKKNGASDGKALILGLGSAAIEWATEKYSVEAILKNPKTIRGFIAENILTEATEEGASNLSNIALDTIVSNVFDERTEIEQRIDYLVTYEGKTAEEALGIAFNEKAQSLGEDILIGGLTGFGMSGGVVTASAVSNTVENAKSKGMEHIRNMPKKAGTNNQNGKNSGIFDNSVGTRAKHATQEDVDAYIDYAYLYAVETREKGNVNFPKQKSGIVIGEVDERLINDIKTSSGVDLTGAVHVINDNDIRHIKNSHGEGTNEKYAVTADDQKQIPDIIKNYDDVLYVKSDGGKEGIYYVKQHNGVTYYLEAIKEGGTTLSNKQMIKVPTGTIPNIKGLKDAINKKWNMNPASNDSSVPRMYVQDVKNNHVPNTMLSQDEIGVKSSVDGRTMSESRKSGKVTAQSLERLTQNNAPITSEEVKKVTGFGDRGSELVAKTANVEGATFYEVMAEVKPSYTAGFNNPDLDIKKVAHTFNSQAQEDAYTAGQIDGKMLALEQEERAKNAVVKKESGFNAENLPRDVTQRQVDSNSGNTVEAETTISPEEAQRYDIPEDSEIVDNIVVDEHSKRLKRENPRAYSNIIRMAKRLRMNVRFVKNLADESGNVLDGFITSKGIFINADAKNPSRFVATHEFGHRMKKQFGDVALSVAPIFSAN